MPPSKGADEKYCSSCGSIIKKQAELCPECGVRNAPGAASTTGSSPLDSTVSPADPESGASVSGDWYIGVLAGLVLWVVVFVAAGTTTEGSGDAFIGLLVIIAWVVLPLSAYFDIQYVMSRSNWRPNEVLWIVGLLLWVVNIPLALVYLYRRNEALRVGE